ncbi:MAG: phage terminase large subunit, partial [Oscillospiraceae bacterium]
AAREFFELNKAEMLSGTEVLWEQKLSYYDLMEMRLTEGDAAFNSEEQNEPINPEDCLFNEEWFEYFEPHELDLSEKHWRFAGFVDPSLGRSKKSDYSAIVTVAQNTDSGYMYVVDADIERRHPDRILDDCIAKAIWIMDEYGQKYYKFGAETNQFQWFLKEQLVKESARRGVYLPIVEVQQTSDKVLRIQTLQPYIKNKYIRFRKNQKRLIEQLKYFPMADHDDGPDALEGCIGLLGKKKRKRITGIRGLGL